MTEKTDAAEWLNRWFKNIDAAALIINNNKQISPGCVTSHTQQRIQQSQEQHQYAHKP